MNHFDCINMIIKIKGDQIGRPYRTRTYDPSHVMGMRYQLR